VWSPPQNSTATSNEEVTQLATITRSLDATTAAAAFPESSTTTHKTEPVARAVVKELETNEEATNKEDTSKKEKNTRAEKKIASNKK